jgi:hypothetical protein
MATGSVSTLKDLGTFSDFRKVINLDYLLEMGGAFFNIDDKWWIPFYAFPEKLVIKYDMIETYTNIKTIDSMKYYVHKEFNNVVVFSQPLLASSEKVKETVYDEHYLPELLQFKTKNTEIDLSEIVEHIENIEDDDFEDLHAQPKYLGYNDVNITYYLSEYDTLMDYYYYNKNIDIYLLLLNCPYAYTSRRSRAAN